VKKLLIIMMALTVSLFSLVACSVDNQPQGEPKEERSSTTDASQKQNVSHIAIDVPQNQDVSNQSCGFGEPTNDTLRDVYTITHEKDCSIYTVEAIHDSEYNFTIYIFDTGFNQLQTIYLGWCPEGIDFKDVNLDGYMDIVANTGGTVNETHDLYIWEASSQNFTKVIYEGFDILSFFEVYEGYIKNFIRGDNPESSVMENLVWDGNKLIKEFEY